MKIWTNELLGLYRLRITGYNPSPFRAAQAMQLIHAIYENGVFRPIEPVTLPESCRVEFEPRIVEASTPAPTSADVYELLSMRFNSGERDVAARHDEHQPRRAPAMTSTSHDEHQP